MVRLVANSTKRHHRCISDNTHTHTNTLTNTHTRIFTCSVQFRLQFIIFKPYIKLLNATSYRKLQIAK